MSVTLEDIEVRRIVTGDMVSFEARLKLTNKTVVPINLLRGMPKEIEERVFHDLTLSIIAHVYGDLIKPINELYAMSNSCPDMTHEQIVSRSEWMTKINRVFKGERLEPLDS